MKTKIFTLLLAVATSVGNLYASKNVVPSDAVLVDYYNQGDVCVCIYVPGEMACNDFVLTGKFNEWSNIPANCATFEPVEGYDGWYVTSFEPEAEPDAEKGIQAKPVMLDYNGNFNWEYQIGAATVIRGGVQVVQGYVGEIDMINYGADAPNVFTVDAWKMTPICGYYISLICDNTKGKVSGNGFHPRNSNATISAIPNNGYHFTQWNDSVTDNPRTIWLSQDTTFIAEFAPNPIITYIFDSEMGTIQGPKTTATGVAAENITFEAISNYGYHFVQWNDSVTDNPRTIWLSQDTTFTAEFAKNKYTISTQSANQTWGTTAGDTTALYMENVEISATANHGYHFVRWNDYNTSNPRMVSVTEDKTFTATFAKNVYYITKNAEHGSISGNSSAEYLDFVTLTVTSDYGYHFTQWSDGLKDNPRIAQITKDTAFTAEFAPDRVGTCGKDMALVWSYDPTNKVLTIGNAGSFTENMQFGEEAPNEMEELVIGNSVTAIGANAFAGIETLKKVSIGESVKTIGEQAFYNCMNIETIFNYRPTPTNTYSNAFDGVDKFECELYVLPSSIDMYKNAAVWRDFYYTYAIGAEETTIATNDVQVEPQDNAATLTWPTSNNAASYTIQITKDGVVFCTLIFNANGQLIGIAFAPGRDGEAHAPAALMTANGLQFTVTGLDSGTQYGYSVTAKDSNDQPVATYSGEFTTTSEGVTTGVDNVPSDDVPCTKVIRNGQIYILRGEKVYTLQGQEVK